ncbi:unnamed protein product [Orchesella dallaii]|uniref:BTB domain-containing protein n=1 Tax=Orchesella dallaii TaxID=48710 RepID=A0ABP1R5Z1_9HEXA
MDLYILENQIISLPTRVDYTLSNFQSFSGSVNFHLQDKIRNESTERGVIQGNHFPWKVQSFQENVFSNKYQSSKETDGSCGFKFELKCTVTMGSCAPSGTFDIAIKGDFVEILKYVYQTDSLPRLVKLNFQAVLTLPGSDDGVALFYGTYSTTTDCKFYSDSELSVSVVEKIFANKEIHLKALTMQLILDEMYSTAAHVNWLAANVTSSAPAPRSAFENFTRKLKNIILKNKISSDLFLVANNGVETPSHKIILAAQSPVLQRLFQKDTKITRLHLNLSEEGMKTFLDFLYCSKFNTQTINSLVAAELLRISHENRIVTLEKTVKDLVMDKPDDWLDFEASLQLYLYFNKLYGYEDLMIKTMAAITMKQDEVDKSDAFKEFLETDRNAAFQFIKRAFCSKKSWIVDNLL